MKKLNFSIRISGNLERRENFLGDDLLQETHNNESHRTFFRRLIEMVP